jgi:hypothetical protein
MLRGIPTYRCGQFIILSIGAFACAAGQPQEFDPSTDGGSKHDAATSDDDDDDASLDGGGQQDGDFGKPPVTNDSGTCNEAAGKFIYLVSDQNALYSFDPPTLALNKLGTLDCPGEMSPPNPDSGEGGVNSMAVDRHATAWVNFNDGKIFKVDTTDSALPCVDAKYKSGQGGFTPQLGMGFATASATDHTETLYVSDNGGPGGVGTPGGGLGLGKLDLSTMKMKTVGAWSSPLAGYNAELTGTGDGKLFGFFTTTPSNLAQIDPTNAKISGASSLSTVHNSDGGYAFSFWGGDFWFYTAFPTDAEPNPTTSITHYVTATKTATVVKKDIGYTIVGAGVSTCAPTKPPT